MFSDGWSRSMTWLHLGIASFVLAAASSMAGAQCDFTPHQSLIAPDAADEDRFGHSVFVRAGMALVGVLQDDDQGMDAGSVFLYEFDGTSWNERQKLTASDGAPGDLFGTAVAGRTGVAVIGAPLSGSTGAVHVFRFDGNLWIEEQKLVASDGEADDRFGGSVAIVGDVILVGATEEDDGGDGAGAAYIFRFDGSTWVEKQKLTAGDPMPGASFGNSVSVTGHVALIGAMRDDDRGTDSGSAYLYRFDGSAWIESAKLTASDAAENDQFGCSVSVCGDIAAVGAKRDDDLGNLSGSAYIYQYDNGIWIESEKIRASDGAAADLFGSTVHVHGHVVVVGAHLDDDAGLSSGSAYVYRFNGSRWIEAQKVTSVTGTAQEEFGGAVSAGGDWILVGATGSNGRAGSAHLYRLIRATEQKVFSADREPEDQFGWSVAIDGDVAVVGAYREDDGGFNTGAAYVYRFNGNSWEEEAKLLASDVVERSDFGRSVSVSGDVIAVGAWGDDHQGVGTGSTYLYRFDGQKWIEEQKLVASDGESRDEYGIAVSVDGDVVAIAAWGDDDLAPAAGAAYVYRYDGTIWTDELKIFASDGKVSDRFGNALSLNGDVLAIGSSLDDDAGNSSGAVYMYRFDGANWFEEQKLIGSETGEGDDFGHAVSVDGDALLIGTPLEDDGGSASGAAYVFRWNGASWEEEQKLTASDPAEFDFYASSVSIDGNLAVVSGHRHDDQETDSGSAYWYEYDGASWVERRKTGASDASFRAFYGFSVAVSGGVAVISAKDDFETSGAAYFVSNTSHCSAGTVNLGVGLAADVLRVNGSSGDGDRAVEVGVGEPITLTLAEPPAGPAAPQYLMWAWAAAPTRCVDLEAGNDRLGCTVNPTPVSPVGMSPLPYLCLRGAGIPGAACAGLPEINAPDFGPWELVHPGLVNPAVFTFQGVVEDLGAGNPRGFSVTNAVTLEVE